MHDARPLRTRPVGKMFSKVIEKRVNKGAGAISISRMNHQTRALVHGKEIVVFIKNRQGKVLRFKFEGSVGDVQIAYPDTVAFGHAIIFARRPPVYQNSSPDDAFLDLRTGEIVDCAGKKKIQSFAFGIRGNDKVGT
jgi:hypothetical protein